MYRGTNKRFRGTSNDKSHYRSFRGCLRGRQQALDRARPARRRPVHGRARRRDRERRAADDQERPSLQPGEPAVGDHRLRDPLRRRAPARRPHGRPARPAAHVHARHGHLHGQLAAGRARAGPTGSLIVFRGRAGSRRRTAGAGRALDPHHDVPRGHATATSRSAIWGAASGSGGAAGVLLGGRAHQRAQLVVDLLHQRSRRRGRPRAQPGAPAREPRRARPPPLRHGRRRVDHRRPDAARLRAHAREPARLGHDRDDRAARGLGRADRRVRRDRDALSRRRCCRCASSACAR